MLNYIIFIDYIMIDPNRRYERVCAVCNDSDIIYKCTKCKFFFCQKDVCANFIEHHVIRGNIGGIYDLFMCCDMWCSQPECK